MRKITLFFTLAFCGFQFAMAQTTLEVGPDKTYTSIKAAWDAAKTETATEIIINVAEGTYVETAEMTGMADKKVTIRGAGADKTIVKRADIADFVLTSPNTVNPGRLFQLNAAAAINLELTLEKMSFQTIGFMNTNGGAVINGNQAGQKFTIKNCNFKNIFARVGTIIQVTTNPIDVVIENCFIEECGTFDNNSHDGLIRVTSGTLTLTNSTFYNNSFDVINRGNTANGTDRDLKNGQILSLGTALTSFVMTDCNIVGNKYITGDAAKIHPLISMKPAVTGVAPDVLLANAAPGFNIQNLISVGNNRSESADCDLYYNVLSAPTATGSIVNSVKSFDLNTVLDADVTSLDGITISGTAAIGTYFEMEGTAPKIATNSMGVKTLVRLTTSVKNSNINNLKLNVLDGKLTITSDKVENIEIFNSMGARVGQFLNTNNVQAELSNGIYIVKSKDFTTKVLVR